MVTYVGLDPSLTGTALVALAENPDFHPVPVARLSIATSPKKFPSAPARLDAMRDRLRLFIGEQCPALVAIEGLALGVRTPHAASWGWHSLACWTLWKAGVDVLVVPPAVLKKFGSGKGNSDKAVMLREVFRTWGYEAKDDDDCDAFVLAIFAREWAAYRHFKTSTLETWADGPHPSQLRVVQQEALHSTGVEHVKGMVRT